VFAGLAVQAGSLPCGTSKTDRRERSVANMTSDGVGNRRDLRIEIPKLTGKAGARRPPPRLQPGFDQPS